MSRPVRCTMTAALATAMAALLCAAAFAEDGFNDGLLSGLPKLKNFKAARQSSYDPSGGNNDGRQDWPIKPGETRQLAKIDGAGAVTHIWTTIATEDRAHLKNLVLRMYWDGEETPSVECPVGDFFGLGHARYYYFTSTPIQIGTQNALNCFWRMPFAKGALVTVTNDGPVPVGAYYYYVDYQLYDNLPADTGRFHAQYRQAYPCPAGKNYTFMEATGRGHYLGVSLSIHNRADGWWGEGDDMIYIDGEEKPTFNGTGSEDYFCGAWCYGQPFSTPFFGCPLRGEHARNALWNVYRFHLADPIPFTKSIRATIEHGHANDRADDWSSVAYWYQAEPHAAFPPFPGPGERLPADITFFTEADAIEAEALAPAINDPTAVLQPMGDYGDKWSDNAQLWFTPNEPRAYKIPVPQSPAEGKAKLELWYTVAPDYGTCELWLNGEKVDNWDGYNKDGVARKKTTETINLRQGGNTVELKITGKNNASTGYYAGIDCIRVTPVS